MAAVVFIVLFIILSPVHSSDNPLPALKKNFLKGYKYTQEGRHDRAVAHLLKIRQLDVAMRDYILFYLGKGLLNRQACHEAREVFRELVQGYPESRWIPWAEPQVQSAEPCPPLILEVQEAERTDCGEVLEEVDRADCLFRQRQYPKAKELYRRLVEGREGAKGQGIFNLTRLSQAASRSQDFETALWANFALRSRYPKTETAREAHRKIAFLHQDAGDYRKAILVLKELVEEARSAAERRHYQERIGWCHFRLEGYREAIAAFDAALREIESPFSLYWKGRSLERLGRKGEGEEFFRQLADIYRGGYYGIRALESLYGRGSPPSRILKEWWLPAGPGLRWEKELASLGESSDLERIWELASLGLFQDAEIEIRRSRSRLGIPLPSDPKKIRKRGGEFLIEMRSLREENPDYRMPFADFLVSQIQASKAEIDPYLLYAMMRQESRFREAAVSPAGAVGILQIMPGTGRRLAREAGWAEYQPSWLYDPVTNIELAVNYVRKLSGLFGGRWHLIAASYNAGEHVVKAWAEQRKGLPEDEFIEEIPYQETKDYVKKVYANWKAYRFIYGAD
jgi:soluble lytic murein transglycosylase